MKRSLKIAVVTLIAMAALATSAPAVSEAEDINKRRGNPSPSIGESNINNYIYQDEQINIDPDDADVLVLRTDQKNLLNRFETKTFELHNVFPREIRTMFRDLTAKEGGRAEVIRDKVGGQKFLQVIAPAWQIEYIGDVVKLIDEEWVEEFNDGTQQIYYQAKHRDIAAIDRIARNWGGVGFTAIDAPNNAATRSDEPYRIEGWLKGAKASDIPEHQAEFRVKVYELASNSDTKIGLDYIAWKNGPGRNLFEVVLAGYEAYEGFSNVSSYLTPFRPRSAAQTGASDQDQFQNYTRYASANYLVTAAYLDFLSVKGKVKTLAEGSVTVRSGETGSFGALDRVVTFNATPNNPGEYGQKPERINDIDGGTAPAGDIAVHNRELQYESTGEVGVAVEISPYIMLESVEADVKVVVSSVAGYTPQGLPILNASRTHTAVRTVDGGTLVLSGLSRTEKVNSKAGMPFFSRLPILGYMFGSETNINRTKDIVVVIETRTETGGDSKLANPPEISTMAYQTTADGAVEVPSNHFGYDQWLLGDQSGPRL